MKALIDIERVQRDLDDIEIRLLEEEMDELYGEIQIRQERYSELTGREYVYIN